MIHQTTGLSLFAIYIKAGKFAALLIINFLLNWLYLKAASN
jgi:hypothetical protein